MAKTSKKDIIKQLEKKNDELQMENDDLQMENDELKAELEELKADQAEKIEALKQEMMAEVMEKINAEKKPKKEKEERTQKDGKICWARVYNDGKGGRCNNTAKQNQWCYCNQHNKQYIDGKLKHGDTRITGKGSIPLFKSFEKKLGYTDDMVCEEIEAEEWLAGF